MKTKIDASPVHLLKDCNVGEFDFWEKLRNEGLKPGTKAFGIEEGLKGKLQGRSTTGVTEVMVCSVMSA